MLDPRLLRSDLDGLARNLARRGFVLDCALYQRLEDERKTLQVDVEELRRLRNERSKEIGKAKAAGEDIESLKVEVEKLGTSLADAEARLQGLQVKLDAFLTEIPNLLHDSVPDGSVETSNIIVRSWGEAPKFEFEPKDHVALGEELRMIDFETAAKLSGSRFVVLHGMLARLHRALIQFMLDVHVNEHGYTESYVPYMVNDSALFGTGQLPKFASDLFTIEGEVPLRLIPTAEVPLSNFARDRIIEPSDLPMRLTAHTPCFRSEAGSYGKDTRGMIRQHQFEKVELVHIVKPEESYDALEELTQNAESILIKLGLPYRVVLLCSGDSSFAAAKTYDIEVWLPSQDRYREISSCSNCESFQARRMKARWKNEQTGQNEFVHTLNGSGLAVGRTLIAILENYQQKDGTVTIPEVMRPYMRNQEVIG